MIIGLTGYAQSGKDTVAKTLIDSFGFKRIAFADAIRDMLFELNPIVDSIMGEPVLLQEVIKKHGWEYAKGNPRVRQYLQNLGVSARNHIDPFVWVNCAIRKMGAEDNIVITDVRFENEASIIKQLGGQIWRIIRPGVAPVNGHISESELADYKADRDIVNASSISDLELIVKTYMTGVLN